MTASTVVVRLGNINRQTALNVTVTGREQRGSGYQHAGRALHLRLHL